MERNPQRRARSLRAVRFALSFLCVSPIVLGQGAQFQFLSSLGRPPASPSAPLLQATDGMLYGTAPEGGANGSGAVFRLNAAGTLEIFYNFAPPYEPSSGLIQASDGFFYGTAASDATTGIVFQLDSSGTMTILHHFTGPDGNRPSGGLIQATDGNFYGTTRIGGAHSFGAVFKCDTSGNLTLLHSFDLTDGANPYAGLIQASDGNFYGTTRNGGANGFGTVFRMDPAGNLTTLHSFASSDGASPSSELIQATDGNFYGVTPAGGAAGLGTIFMMDSAGTLTTLHSFAGTDGEAPLGALLQASDGNLYGTTSAGGRNGDGTIFLIDLAGNLTTLHDFLWTDGANSTAALIQAADGRLYGTTLGGGQASGGTVFSTDLSGSETVLIRFKGGTDGTYPFAGLLQGSDGFLYGTTSAGGAYNMGSIFRMDTHGQVATLYSFSGSDGANPQGALIEAPDGYFYGTTEKGGYLTICQGGCGTVFKMDSSGNLTVLHRFQYGIFDGASPDDALLFASDGNFYGTASGGLSDRGTIFKIDSSGNESIVHNFDGPDGAGPHGTLVQATDGNLYGATFNGGSGIVYCGGGCGTVYRMDLAGNLTTIHDFNGGPDSSSPRAGLIQASDGYLYGTTVDGGSAGTIFKISLGGSFTTIHEFTIADGASPITGLFEASDGNLYGTTPYGGGSSDDGVLYKVDTSSAYSVVHVFGGPDGARPYGSIIQGQNGLLYGTTYLGGGNGLGAVYQLFLPAVLSIADMSVRCGPAAGATPSFLTGNFPPRAVLAVTLGGAPVAVTRSAQGVEIVTPQGTAGEVADLSVADAANPDQTVTLARAFVYDFLDLASGNPFHDFVCKIVRNNISAGCGGGEFCPGDPVLRSQMAIFLLQGEDGSVYVAPAADCAANPFTDVPCPSVFANYILELYNEGITGGCSANPLRFCPDDPVSRADMAVFLLTAKHGTGYVPPACTGVFTDVPCPGTFTNWIEQLYAEGITGGCGANPLIYCPNEPVTRAQMAVFLAAAFALP